MRSWPAVLASAALVVTLAACGEEEADPNAEDTPTATSSPTAGETPTPAASETPAPAEPPSPSEEAGPVVVISIKDDRISPGGDRLEVDRDEVVALEITSDRAGELHVHSKPEQYVEFEAGTSTHELVVSAPGVVDVEEHETGHVVVQLEVS